MKNLFTLITSSFVGVIVGLQAKNDEDVINKLSSFKASGADYSWDKLPQDTKYRKY